MRKVQTAPRSYRTVKHENNLKQTDKINIAVTYESNCQPIQPSLIKRASQVNCNDCASENARTWLVCTSQNLWKWPRCLPLTATKSRPPETYFSQFGVTFEISKHSIWRNILCSSIVSLRFVLSRVCVFLYSLGPMAQDYKEKDKLDSKQISDSAFGAHLSLCPKWETIKLFKIKLKTHSSNSGLTGSWRILYPAGKNVTKIGTQ